MHSAAISFFTRTWRAHAHPWRWASSLLVAVTAMAVSLAPPAVAPVETVGAAAAARAAGLPDPSARPPLPGADPVAAGAGSGPTRPPTPAQEERLAAALSAARAKPVLPVGKGMWMHRYSDAYGGDPHAIVGWAKQMGLTHIYVRLGSSKKGFYARNDLDRLLPVAHAAGIKVVGWDFPYLEDPEGDAQRSFGEAAYTTPTGHRIDAFAADIETPSEGTVLTAERASYYVSRLRGLVGADYPLIAAVPRYNPSRNFPYAEIAPHVDAFAPMVYWINRDPASDVIGSVDYLRQFGKPILPVGQAYDPAIDGNPQWGPPGRAQIDAFMKTAADRGVAGVSFWAWNTASVEQWTAIQADSSFDLTTPDKATRTMAVQRVLTGLGHPAPVTGAFDLPTTSAVTQFQARVGLPPTGELDGRTMKALVHPTAG